MNTQVENNQASNNTNTINNTQNDALGYNLLDPYVVNDPVVQQFIMLQSYVDDTNDIGGPQYSKVLHDGIDCPMIEFCGVNVDPDDIIDFRLHSIGFMPTLYLHMKDTKHLYKNFNNVELDKEIKVVFTESVDKLWKKVSLIFTVDNTHPLDEPALHNNPYDYGDYSIVRSDIYVHGVYKLFELNDSKSRNLLTDMGVYDKNEKDKFEKAKTSLTTYETFDAISRMTGLGFVVTPKCEEIDDAQPRFLKRSLSKYMQNITQYAGVDEDSVFMSWIDIYHNLTLCNFSYLMSVEFNPTDLVTRSISGQSVEMESLQHKSISDLESRILTNDSRLKTSNNNLYCEAVEIISSYEKIKKQGTSNIIYKNSPDTTAGGQNNKLEKSEIMTKTNTINGLENHDKYAIQKQKILDPDFSERGIKYQHEIVKSTIAKHSTRIYKFSLRQPNLGLMRGMLCSVVWYYTTQASSLMGLKMNKNMHPDSQMVYDADTGELYNDDSQAEQNSQTDIVTSNNMGVINYNITGTYYITGIEFKYRFGQFVQELYCIRKTPLPNTQMNVKINEEKKQ